MSNRILWLTQSYPSETDPIAGIFHKTQAEALAELGMNIEIVAPSPSVPAFIGAFSEKWLKYSQLPLQTIENGVKIYRPKYLALPQQSKWASPHLRMERKASSLGLSKPDLIHAHFAYPQGLMAIKLGRKWNVPTVLTLHGSDVNAYPNYNRTAMKRFAAAVRGASRVIAVSRALAERTKRLSGREPELMPIGIKLSRFTGLPSREEARKRLGLPENRFLVLFVGFLLEAKGVRELLTALQKFPQGEVSGIFVGGGPLLEEVQAQAHVKAAGTQTNEQVALYMAAADVLALPSYSEGMPTVLIEAGAARLPVIAARVGGVPELLGEERGYLIESKSVDQIVQAIDRVRSNREEAGRYAEALRDYVYDHYDANKNADCLREMYGAELNAFRASVALKGDNRIANE